MLKSQITEIDLAARCGHDGANPDILPLERRTKYDIPEKIDPSRLNPYEAHAIILRQIPSNSRVLDIGCATGYLGHYLIEEQGCLVDGIECSPQAAEVAGQYYRHIWVGSVEDEELLASIPGPYDVVMCAALIEHLVNPDLVLQSLRRLLTPQGRSVVSIPNVAHCSVRWRLFIGRWDYTDYGLLDRTHLRFYTLDTGRALIESAGYRVEKIEWSNVGAGPLEIGLRWLPRGRYRLRHWLVNRFPTWFGYEFIFVSKVL